MATIRMTCYCACSRDFRYRSANTIEFENSAVVIYMMDVSGSMGDGKRNCSGLEFLDKPLAQESIQDIEIRYIIHDATAKRLMKTPSFH